MKKHKTVQYFSDFYLQQTRNMTPAQIVQFLEDFRKLHSNVAVKEESVLISIRLPKSLLNTLKTKAELSNQPYQRFIKEILRKAV